LRYEDQGSTNMLHTIYKFKIEESVRQIFYHPLSSLADINFRIIYGDFVDSDCD
jgi:hypothetical protein